MVNKCVVFGCKTGYETCVEASEEKISTFKFPLEKTDLLQQWIKFVNRSHWYPSKNSVICVKHFDKKYIVEGKRNKLNWNLNPVPTIQTREALKIPSAFPTPVHQRRAPKSRYDEIDQLNDSKKEDNVKKFEDLEYKTPFGFNLKKKTMTI